MKLYSVVTLKINKNGTVSSKAVHAILTDKEQALSIVEKNLGDIYEYYYDYGIVEEFETGMNPFAKILKWVKLIEYKDNVAILEEVPCPECFKNMSGFSF